MATTLFSNYPKTYYSFSNTPQNLDLVTNIMSRFIIEPALKTNTAAYYWYSIKESETPEVIANKVYKSPYRYWIVLQFNDIIDIRTQWPLSYSTLVDYLESKYKTLGEAQGVSGLIYSRTNIHSYYLRQYSNTSDTESYTDYLIDQEMSLNTEFGGQEGTFTDSTGNTVTLSWQKFNKTFYDFELEENEAKRRIKLLKPEFVAGLESSLKNIYRT